MDRIDAAKGCGSVLCWMWYGTFRSKRWEGLDLVDASLLQYAKQKQPGRERRDEAVWYGDHQIRNLGDYSLYILHLF